MSSLNLPGVVFHVTSDDVLTLTVEAARVDVCGDCPNVHVMLVEDISGDRLRAIAAGLAHMADHLDHPNTGAPCDSAITGCAGGDDGA